MSNYKTSLAQRDKYAVIIKHFESTQSNQPASPYQTAIEMESFRKSSQRLHFDQTQSGVKAAGINFHATKPLIPRTGGKVFPVQESIAARWITVPQQASKQGKWPNGEATSDRKPSSPKEIESEKSKAPAIQFHIELQPVATTKNCRPLLKGGRVERGAPEQTPRTSIKISDNRAHKIN